MRITDFLAWVGSATPFQTWWIVAGFLFHLIVVGSLIAGILNVVL